MMIMGSFVSIGGIVYMWFANIDSIVECKRCDVECCEEWLVDFE